MKLTGIYGDGYEEPKEYDYTCEECGISCSDNECFGIEWSDE